MTATLLSPTRSTASDRNPRPHRAVTGLRPVMLPAADDIEYVFSSEFTDPAAEAAILAPPPVSDEPPERITPPSDTPPYLARLYEVPLLTKEQEFHLFRQMNFRKYRAQQWLSQSRVTSAMRCRAADELVAAHELRNAIVEANLRLVVSIAKTVTDAANSIEDLISEGNVPLMRAVEIFDFTRGLRFSTYATWAVRHRLFRCTPRNRRYARQFVVGTETPFAMIPDDRSQAPPTTEPAPLRSAVVGWLRQLPDRERTIIEARFGLDSTHKPAKFREIAARLGISTERTRQLHLRAVGKLRDLTASSGLDLADVLAAS